MTLPATMTAIAITTPGGPEVLKPESMATPTPGVGEVLIKVAAAGVNRPDILQRQGGYPPPKGAPLTPGLEVAGTIVAVGDGTPRWKVGDQVCALVAGGGYAEYCLAPGPQCLPIPQGLSLVEAAGLPETFFTVWTNVFERGRLADGETLMIHGGASGIGTTAIQIAAALGHTVYATAGGPDKARACEKLGAKRGIDYKSEDFAEIIKAETGGRGVDVILDMVAGDYFPKNLMSLAVEGRLVHIAFLRGPVIETNLMPIMLKRLTVTGSTLRPQEIAAKGRIAAGLEARVWPLLAAGKIKPVIDSTYPLAEASKAHARLDQGTHIGKVILTIG